jgi:hypothetical protein
MMERHAQAAMAEAHDNLRRATPLLLRRIRGDAALNAEIETLRRLEPFILPLGDDPPNIARSQMLANTPAQSPCQRTLTAHEIKISPRRCIAFA